MNDEKIVNATVFYWNGMIKIIEVQAKYIKDIIAAVQSQCFFTDWEIFVFGFNIKKIVFWEWKKPDYDY